MKVKITPDECIGCTACLHSCPKNAINIKMNNEGFLCAHINQDKCVDCGICINVCPVQQKTELDTQTFKNAYACYIKNTDIQRISTSGGVFYSIAKAVLNENGKVYGATMDKNLKVKHILIEKVQDLHKIQGSKYIQSELSDVFVQIKKFLENGQYVLFSGTGCQVAGLKQYLKNDYQNLLTVDLICHGIPSPGLFADYITYLEKKNHGKITSYKFRQKNPNQEQSYDTKIEFLKNNSIVEKTISGDDDPYTINYLQNTLQNNECFKCKYASLNRVSDITLGDYWGINEMHPEFANGNSVSLVLLNTDKALVLWDNINSDLEFIPTDKEKILKHNHQLSKPAPYNSRREAIYSNYSAGKFNTKFYNKYFLGKALSIYLLKRKIKKLLR